MTTSAEPWDAAVQEHEDVLARFRDAVRRVPAGAWNADRPDGGWSPAAVALHVARSYEYGCETMTSGARMRLRVPQLAAWFSRTVLLPRLLASKGFPRGAESPGEVRPDLERSRTIGVDEALGALSSHAERAVQLLRSRAADRGARVVHAYFGALTPLEGLRLLSAHTRHHARQLERYIGEQPGPLTGATAPARD